METKNNDFDYIVTPFPERIARILRLPYPVAWLIISGFLFGLHVGGCLYSGSPVKLAIVRLAILALLPTCIATGIVWFSKALEKFTPSIFLFIDWPRDKILEWYESELRSIFNLKWMVLTGVVLAGVCLISGLPHDFWAGFRNLPTVTFRIMMVAVGFLGGGMFYAMIRIALMVHKMGKLEAIKVSIYQHPLTSVKSVGNLLGKIALVAIGIYLLGMLYVFGKTGEHGKLVFWIVVFFAVVVGSFFVFPQIKIHQMMSKVKHMRLREFSRHLEEALEGVTREPSRESVQRVRELFEIQKSLNEMGEWPFDTRKVFLIITGIAIPLIVVLLQIIWSKLGD
jgi:hypothetical protein